MANDKNEIETKKVEVQTKSKDKSLNSANKSENNNLWVWIIGIVIVVGVIGMFATMSTFAFFAKNHHINSFTDDRFMRSGMMGARGFDSERGRHFIANDDINSNNQQAITGVVTAVSGDNFTVAGNGSTNSVTTDSNTQYSGDTKVNVNDSVAVIGSTNNSTFTASQVIIRNIR